MCKPLDHLVDLSGGSQKTSPFGKSGTETRPSAFIRRASTVSSNGCVVLSKGCYANALQRRETAKNHSRHRQLSRVDPRVMRTFASVSRPCFRTVMPGQHLQSALWAVPYPKNSSAVRRACSNGYLCSRSGRRLHHARANLCRQRFCSDYFCSLHIVGQDGLGMKRLAWVRCRCAQVVLALVGLRGVPAALRLAGLRLFFQGVALRPAGLAGPLMVRLMP